MTNKYAFSHHELLLSSGRRKYQHTHSRNYKYIIQTVIGSVDGRFERRLDTFKIIAITITTIDRCTARSEMNDKRFLVQP